ncbi:MAG: formimidoylglutamate deiminase [Pyrinomonas sp.]|uniref:formimidoylglutamate deiminase n=1 Tax=Pyrinomonas sp. TaxID=2080306 RepID=UPI00331C7E09
MKGETAWLADLVYVNGRFEKDLALVCDRRGRIVRLAREVDGVASVIDLRGRAILPGLVNAHSHAFQRALRARTEGRRRARETFWTWRDAMYALASRLEPEDVYDVSRMAFLEMALSGITTVGEFHYLHNAPDGETYAERGLLAKEVVRAALAVGLRICLLDALYMRAGFNVELDRRQRRFITSDPSDYFLRVETLRKELDEGPDGRVRIGLAPHSLRAVPLGALREAARFGSQGGYPFHMHVAEQLAEVEACLREYGRTPVRLLAEEGFLDERFTAVHAIHVDHEEIGLLGRARVCACPTTERNLGDGVVPADALCASGARIALGTDSHAQVDLLEDARELELNLRLKNGARAILAPPAETDEAAFGSLAARLFEMATVNGAQSLGLNAGKLASGSAADFFTVDLQDAALAGADAHSLLSHIIFAGGRSAVRDVVIGGRRIVEDGRHGAQDVIIERFIALQRKLWSGA